MILHSLIAFPLAGRGFLELRDDASGIQVWVGPPGIDATGAYVDVTILR